MWVLILTPIHTHKKSYHYYPHINLCMDHISHHKMMQSSTVYMGIYIIQTRVPVRIYTAIVKKSNRLWEKIGSYCYIFCLLIFRCWLNHKFSGQTLLKKDSSIWLCTCHFRSNRNRKYKPKTWYWSNFLKRAFCAFQ